MKTEINEYRRIFIFLVLLRQKSRFCIWLDCGNARNEYPATSFSMKTRHSGPMHFRLIFKIKVEMIHII